jgi:hypothetical protein
LPSADHLLGSRYAGDVTHSGMVVDTLDARPHLAAVRRRSMKDAVDAVREVHRLICWS